MKIVTIISRYTSANRSSKNHADDGSGKPLCGDKPSGRFNGWSQDEGEVTCSRCKKLLTGEVVEPIGSTWATNPARQEWLVAQKNYGSIWYTTTTEETK